MHPMSELVSRLAAVLLLPALALFCVLWDAALWTKLAVWGGWLGLALLQDWFGPRVAPAANGRRSADGPVLRSLAWVPLLSHAMALGVATWAVSVRAMHPSFAEQAAWAGMLGISAGTAGISAAHELVHRRNRLERGLAQAFMLLVTYPHFPLVHLRIHHVWVGTAADPGTSRRGEPLFEFIPRAVALAWKGGWRSEAERLTRLRVGLWNWDNRMLRLGAVQAALLALILLVAGAGALAFFLAQSIVAVFLMLAVDYTQHYAVERREAVPGRLERVHAGHAWTTDHASNRTTFNLGLHADHHLAPARSYPRLANARGSLQAPLGYPGLVLLALVPPLWFRVMHRRLPASNGIIDPTSA